MKKDVLLLASLGYLFLPSGLFLLGWLRPAWGIPLVLVLVGVVLSVALKNRLPEHVTPLTLRVHVLLIGLSLFYCLVAGVGELNHQKSDYDKHNLMMHDLITKPHPVVYQNPAYGTPLLCYYVAYYLPPALAAKAWGGIGAARWWWLLWSSLGMCLVFNWLYRLGKPHGVWVAGLFFLFSGLDVGLRLFWIAQYRLNGRFDRLVAGLFAHSPGLKFYVPPHVLFSNNLRGIHLELPAPLTQWQWAPQHALGSWLAISLVVSQLTEYRRTTLLGLILGGTLLWSPFGALGLLPFMAWGWLKLGWKTSFSPESILGGGALGVVVGAYFLSHWPQQYAGWLWPQLHTGANWALYGVFLLAQVGVFWAGVAWLNRHEKLLPPDRYALFSLAALTLVLFSLGYVGKFNDWYMRAVLPAQWVLATTLIMTVVEAVRRQKKAWGFYAVLLVSAYFPMRQTATALWDLGRPPKMKRSVERATVNFGEADVSRISRDTTVPEADFAAQYLGRQDSFFGQFLMKTPHKSRE